MIYCIMHDGDSLNDMVRGVLLKLAVQLMRTGKKWAKVVHDDAEGFVKTKFEHGLLGTIAGIIFEADIATKKGTSKVKYLVRPFDVPDEAMNDGWWEDADPDDLQPKRKKLHGFSAN